MNYNEINKTDFINLLNELTSGDKGYKSLGLHDCYIDLMVEKLKRETGLEFYYRSGDICSSGLNIKISVREITSYEDLSNKVKVILNEKAEQNANEFGVDANKLASEWGYMYSHSDSSPYFYENERYWHCYGDYSQKFVLEALYFGVTGEFHTGAKFIYDIAEKYFEGDKWDNKPKMYKGEIEELKNLTVAFNKNGKITVKTKDENFWKRIAFFYKVCDPELHNHKVN